MISAVRRFSPSTLPIRSGENWLRSCHAKSATGGGSKLACKGDAVSAFTPRENSAPWTLERGLDRGRPNAIGRTTAVVNKRTLGTCRTDQQERSAAEWSPSSRAAPRAFSVQRPDLDRCRRKPGRGAPRTGCGVFYRERPADRGSTPCCPSKNQGTK